MTIQESPPLSALLKQILSNRIGYAYQHAHLTCVFGDFILSKTPKYDQKHLEILAFAAFFSDITLKTPEQVRINSQDDLENSSLNDEEKQIVQNHAKEACDMLKGSKLMNAEVLKVIREQHGSEDGVGFPLQVSEEIGSIAKVFMVANGFVKIMLDPQAPKGKKDILSILYAQFDSPSYHKIIKVLENKIN
jgi:HD-GYP domain-containing protein (c-di-GMP phosphodiesterase class II)